VNFYARAGENKMVKKLLIAALTLSMLVPTVAMADGRQHRGGYHKNNHQHHQHNNRWVAPLVGGVILGGIIANRNYYYEQPRVYVQPEPQYYIQPICYDILVTEYDRYGRPYQYYIRECR
jgi:hypothetical protein